MRSHLAGGIVGKRGVCVRLLLLFGLFSLALGSYESLADEVSSQTAFQHQLAAGEFAPALQIALQSQTPKLKDQRLAAISAAQRAAGMSYAAVRSAGEITDDRLLSQTLSQTSGYPGSARGGAVEPDFDSLIDLITGTIAPNTWDGVGGPGAVDEFAGGVYVDATGVLAPLIQDETTGRLSTLHANASLSVTGLRGLTTLAASENESEQQGVRRKSALRMISLPRLERAAQMRVALGKPLTDEMKYLAGIQQIKHVFIYPDSGDIVLAGPAEGWEKVTEDRVVGSTTGTPALRLEDFVVVMRHMFQASDARFGCSITPTQENLARTKAFLEKSSRTSLPIGKRKQWLASLRENLGKQTIDVYGIDPRTRAARVLVEADYRMKLVGMGLEPGVMGVSSYLDQIHVKAGESPPPMDVLRWWFTLNYQAVQATKDRKAYEFHGQGLQVLSENELLTQQGKRVHTGRSDELNSLFAQSFTKHFPQLAAKYPIYAELRNLCDMALACALIREERLAERTAWHAPWFGAEEGYMVQFAEAPQMVETVINHRVINRRHIVAGVSGGVRVDPSSLVAREAIKIDSYGDLEAEKLSAQPKDLPRDVWWWDRNR